ncbi:Planctomycete cytochrome C [Polystyrenella longa]|uniref:Planctomycete cytochrome C n=1 Tax=Polystyrenella longa TaxID=2528007 RepID=A0A518CPS9_9PLAN|nr:PSD1 and planctomycete cytochrome C domain-containing protein [Polystyrenella longa]QDU81237.1 Planctomycete cytochrome C [Polystyrenella longa]
MRFIQLYHRENILSGLFGLALILLIGSVASSAEISEAEREQHKFFETNIRPLLAKHCYECHSANEQKGNLRLDHPSFLKSGGDSGEVIVAGKPDESLLLEAVRYESFEMPPEQPISDKEIALLETWIKQGAYWPEEAPPSATAGEITEEDKNWWAYQPIQKPDVPNADTFENAIDAFVAQKYSEQKLTAAPQADKATLIRRLYFDVVGLPPTPEEVSAFVNSDDPAAYEKLVDQLLASPQYGEHWGRHWLDVVRYADSDGWRKDDYRPSAWRYRDYVIKSFNDDKPYDQFIREQLAGDEIAPEDPEALAATGFLRLGIYEYNQRDAVTQWHNIVDEITDVTSDVFLATGLACARCHNHKFDPLLQADYYNLRSFFEPLVWRDDVPFATGEEVAAYEVKQKAWEEKTADIRKALKDIQQEYLDIRTNQAVSLFPLDVQAAWKTPTAERNSWEHQLAYMVDRQAEDKRALANWNNLKGEKKENWKRLDAELKKFDKMKPQPLPSLPTVSDAPGEVSETRIPDKSNSDTFSPAYLTVLGGEVPEIKPTAQRPESSGRRTALANWIADPSNPITTRVMVNRVWQYHFGRGIVSSPNDFGQLGTKPSHPELLDWLASEFIENGLHLKPLHRMILLSDTYQQSAFHPEEDQYDLIDPTNIYLWRSHIRRLSAEEIRDSMLAATGELDLQQEGEGIKGEHNRRSIYFRVLRNSPVPFLHTMGTPDGIRSAPTRYIATTAPQALLMLNGEFTYERARKLAERWKEISDHTAFIDQVFISLTGQTPTESQLQQGLQYLSTGDEADLNARRTDFCHVLLNSNLFLYVE